jgi:hypothetical protein
LVLFIDGALVDLDCIILSSYCDRKKERMSSGLMKLSCILNTLNNLHYFPIGIVPSPLYLLAVVQQFRHRSRQHVFVQEQWHWPP